MLTLTLIRHARTAYSDQGLFMGSTNPPLLEKYKDHIIELKKELDNFQYDKIFSSPYLRALGTAELLFPNRDIEVLEELKERSLGEWEKKKVEQIKQIYPEGFLDSGYINPYYTPPNGGEKFDAFICRIMSFINDLENLDNKYKNDYQVIAISHNGVMRAIKCIIENCNLIETFYSTEPYLERIIYVLKNKKWVYLEQTYE